MVEFVRRSCGWVIDVTLMRLRSSVECHEVCEVRLGYLPLGGLK